MNQYQIPVSLRCESDDACLNRDVLAVCRDAVDASMGVVGQAPALGPKPVVVQQASDGIPRACLNGLPKEYLVNVICLHSRQYDKLAFQVGHEMGHFFVDPHYSNWFVESACTAVSLLLLTALSQKWSTDPPFRNWRPYAANFEKYRHKTVGDALRAAGLSGPDQIKGWIDGPLGDIVGARQFTRQHEMLCAEMIAKIVVSVLPTFSIITRLGSVSRAEGKTDLVRWRAAVQANEAPGVDALATVFGHLME